MEDIVMQAISVLNKMDELRGSFMEVQQPRSNYVLKNLVVGEKDTPPQAYVQCVIELQVKYYNLRVALLEREKTQLEIDEIRNKEGATRIELITADINQVHLEQQELSILGTLREFWCLYAIWKEFPQYTRDEIEEDQEAYWKSRILRQSAQDINSTGRVGQGNQDAIRQLKMTMQEAERMLNAVTLPKLNGLIR